MWLANKRGRSGAYGMLPFGGRKNPRPSRRLLYPPMDKFFRMILPSYGKWSGPCRAFRGLRHGDISLFPEQKDFREIFWQWLRLWAKSYAISFGHGDPFSLPFADILPFVLSHKGKYLQDKVSNKGAEQIFVVPRVEQGHIQDEDVNLFFFGKKAPLLLNLLVIAPEPINADNAELIAGFKAF